MAAAPLRKDAARNWHRIVEVGRRFVDEGTPIQLNDVARAGDDPYAGLRDFLYASVDALLADASLSPVFAAPVNVLPHTAELKRRLADLSGRILDRVRAS
ncbi:hypothetical protein AB0M50_55905 [Nonomuraea fuscirosea]|uniref:hypothetical protein n=1 Tax=Nonomuraea fuscirosea TaxID=1291556 RepID=UPI002DD93C2E|nr:hypothetical protein [Nonomuraea fuscirosea]WSA55826.1 hypothetical protein OIE67_14825 [Nonomuraea fuscirosea]